MLDYTELEKKKISADSSHKELRITFLDADFDNITNERIYSESLSITESLCDMDNLRFGECNSAQMNIQVADVANDIKGHEIRLDLTVDGVLVPLGIFYINNVEKATDKRYKKLTCYDRMYYMNADVITWYNQLYPTVDTKHTLKEFRDSFFTWMGIEQEDVTLVNDDMIVLKTIDATELSGLDVIKAICEINGAFGHINRYGVFEYKYLDNFAIYPSETLYPREELYPGGGSLEEITDAYYIPPSEQGDYLVRSINKLQIRQEEGDIGAIVTAEGYIEDENNSYIINSNFLVYGNSAEELSNIASNLGTKIFGITYTPNSTNAVAMPYLEVGDGFYVSSQKTPFTSFILKRTLSGIQGMRDMLEARGEEFQPDMVKDSNAQIIHLQSRVNILRRTVDENKLEISRIETNLNDNYSTTTQMNSAIKQTADSINLSVSKSIQETKSYADTQATNALNSANGATDEKLKSYSTTTQMNSAIKQSADSITLTVSETYETKGNANANYSSLSTSITQTSQAIDLKADKNGVIGAINVSPETIKISANKLELNGIATFISDSGYVTESDLGANGTTVINGGRIDTASLFSRDITATNLKLTGDSSLQLGATNVADKQYIYLVGTYEGTVHETGLFPSRFYTLSADGFSMNITSQSIAFGKSGDTLLNITSKSDGTVWYSAKSFHEFYGDVIVQNRLLYIAGMAYHDIIKIIQNNIILGNLVDYTE